MEKVQRWGYICLMTVVLKWIIEFMKGVSLDLLGLNFPKLFLKAYPLLIPLSLDKPLLTCIFKCKHHSNVSYTIFLVQDTFQTPTLHNF